MKRNGNTHWSFPYQKKTAAVFSSLMRKSYSKEKHWHTTSNRPVKYEFFKKQHSSFKNSTQVAKFPEMHMNPMILNYEYETQTNFGKPSHWTVFLDLGIIFAISYNVYLQNQEV